MSVYIYIYVYIHIVLFIVRNISLCVYTLYEFVFLKLRKRRILKPIADVSNIQPKNSDVKPFRHGDDWNSRLDDLTTWLKLASSTSPKCLDDLTTWLKLASSTSPKFHFFLSLPLLPQEEDVPPAFFFGALQVQVQVSRCFDYMTLACFKYKS